MKNYDYHSLFYYQILARIKGFRAGDGEKIVDRLAEERDSPQFHMGFEPRDEEYRHNYLRDKHLSTRDILITAKAHETARDTVIMVRAKRSGESITVYKKAVEFVFKDKAEDAMRELVELMSKFYDVTIAERSDFSKVDFNDGRYSNHGQVYELQ